MGINLNAKQSKPIASHKVVHSNPAVTTAELDLKTTENPNSPPIPFSGRESTSAHTQEVSTGITEPTFILHPRLMFYEFLPHQATGSSAALSAKILPLLSQELTVGEDYEVG